MSEENKRERLFHTLSPDRQDVFRVVAFALLYFVAHHLSFLFPDAEKILMAVWPAGGIGLAALLVNPRRLWPVTIAALFVAGNAANLSIGRPPFNSIGFMTANVLESLGCAWLIIRMCGDNIHFSRTKEIIALICAAVFVNTATAFIGAGTASIAHVASFWNFWKTWWVADGLGILLITPFIVTWIHPPNASSRLHWGRTIEWGLFFSLWLAVGWLTFQNQTTNTLYTPQPYILFALLAWPALRFGQRSVTIALVMLAILAINSKTVSAGPLLWGGNTPEERLILVQLYMGVIAVTGFLLTAGYQDAQRATKLALEEQKKLRNLGDNLPNGMVYQVVREHDGRMRFLYVSAGVERLHGVSIEEVLRDPGTLYRQIAGEDRNRIADAEEKSAKEMEPFSMIARFRRPDGQLRWMHLSSSPRRLEDGRILWDGIDRDITEQKLVEERLATERENFLTIFAAAPVGLLLLDTETMITQANKTAADLVLREPAEVIGKRGGGGLGCIHSLEDPRGCGFSSSCPECPLRNGVESVLANGQCIHGAEINPTLLIDGTPQQRWLSVNVEPIKLMGKQHVIVAIDDITERKALENQLHRFKSTLDQAHDCVFMFSPDTLKFFYANQGAMDHVGYAEEELQQMTPLDITPQFTEKSFQEMLAPLVAKRQSSLRVETVHKHKNGTTNPVDIFLQYIAPDNEEGRFVAIVRDISERKELESKLREYGEQQQTLLQEVNHRVKNNLTAIISMLHLEEDRAGKQGAVGDKTQLKEVVTAGSTASSSSTVCSLLPNGNRCI